MSWAAVVVGAVEVGYGIYQYQEGKEMAKNNKRPDYQIPDEIKQNLSQAQMQALEGLPAEQKKEYLDNVQRQQNFGLNALGDRKAGISGLAALTQNGNDANRNLLSMDAQARQQNQSQLMNARSQMAGFKDKDFELNKLLPFQQTAQAAQALQGAGSQNMMSGLKSGAGAVDNNAIANAYGDQGQKTGSPTQPAMTANATQPIPPAQQYANQGGLNNMGQQSQNQQYMNETGGNIPYAQWAQQKNGRGLGFQNNLTY